MLKKSANLQGGGGIIKIHHKKSANLNMFKKSANLFISVNIKEIPLKLTNDQIFRIQI